MVEPMMSMLRSIGRSPSSRFVEGANTVDAILATAATMRSDLVIMGATRRLFTEQAWTSVSARVMERTACPLLLMPALRLEDTGEIPRIEL